ncbi:GATA transcription factor 23-like [Oryza brachyantha]|uniref:GATA-type domain-containing protein n=1 Tax=Oryza brachyantha TaxID=4533 RepID=J3KZK3_ORYBR|nr:GATA transcription factor 23-like [Oryza brachyantha]
MGSTDREVVGIDVAEDAARRSCVECRATTTPMWRSGPTGPRSLCNACGIRYRKKRRQDLGLDLNQQPQRQHGEVVIPEAKDSNSNSNSNSSSGSSSSNLQAVQKRRLLMGVEEAALLLMTLSSPSSSTLLHG